jgi:hypothetical protein
MLHYNPQHVSNNTMLIFRGSNCIVIASGIVTLPKQLFSAPVESGLRMRTSCKITKALNMLSEYVILLLIALPLQQWL